MENNLRILMLEDFEADAELAEREMKKAGIVFASKRVWTKDDFLEQIRSFAPDLILADYSLPQFSGLAAIRLLKEQNLDIPLLLVTGSQTEEVAVSCMREGAADYILKQSLKRLPSAVRTILRERETEKQRARAEARLHTLQELERMRETFVGMIVHDLRNPLTAAVGYIQMSETKAKAYDPQLMKYLNNAHHACHRLLELINQMLDIMRMEDGRMPLKRESRGVATIVQEKADEYRGAAESRGLTLTVDLPDGDVQGNFDDLLIRRALGNLIVNANKHTPQGGTITLGARATAGSGVAFWVRDTGEGIPPEYHAKIFEKYGQVEIKKMGQSYDTGLGLVFCRMAAELHGGKISVASAVGRGSTFTIEIPPGSKKDSSNA